MSLASYRPHSFFIQVGSLADLLPKDEPALPCAVPAYVHEYIHFLHNVSTGSGVNLFRANLWLVRLLRECADPEGRVVREEPAEESLRRWLKAALQWNEALYGGAIWPQSRPPEKVIAWTFHRVRRDDWKLDLSGIDHVVERVAVEIGAQTRIGPMSGRLDIGYDFISEGVAYEVERETYCANGFDAVQVDDRTPAFPYLAFQPLLDHFVGRTTTSRERIELGVLSLLTTSPAATLVDLCERLGQLEPLGNVRGVPSTLVNCVHSQLTEPPLASASGLEADLESMFVGEWAAAAEEIKALFQAGLALRTVNPFLERSFLGRPLDVDELRQTICTLVDCCVIQERSQVAAELRWEGPGIVGTDPLASERLAIIQAAFHYATRHLHHGQLLLTSFLPKARCPFSGSCSVEKKDGHPIECKERPWERFRGVSKDQPKCWYATGVDFFRIPV